MAMRSTASAVSSGVAKLSNKDRADKRRKKLRTNLVGKVLARYSHGRTDLPALTAQQKRRLEDDIDDLLDVGTVSEADVTRLAARLRKEAHQQGAPYRSESAPPPQVPVEGLPPISDPPKQHLSAEALAANDVHAHHCAAGTGFSAVSSLARGDTKIAQSAKPSVIRRRENLVCDEQWNRVIEQDLARYAEEQREHKRKLNAKMNNARVALDEQVEEINRLKKMEQDEARRFAGEEQDRRERWQQEEQRRVRERHQNAMKEKGLRDKQLEQERNMREEETRNERREEEEYRARLQAEASEAAKAEAERRAKNLKEYRQFMAFNKAEQEKKKELQEHEKALDKDMLAAHAALLEKQERDRIAQLRRFQNKATARTDQYMKVYEAHQAKLMVEEQRREKEMEKIAEKQKAEDQLRVEKLRAEKRGFIDTLEKQLKAKTEEKRREYTEQREFRDIQEHEVRASIMYDQEQRQRRREAAKKHLTELNSQVAEKHERNMRDIQVGIARQIGGLPASPSNVGR